MSETAPTYFLQDGERFDSAFRKAGAVVTTADGFTYVDESKVPGEMARAYRRWVQHGMVNGWMA
jgi:hypothetical protein